MITYKTLARWTGVQVIADIVGGTTDKAGFDFVHNHRPYTEPREK